MRLLREYRSILVAFDERTPFSEDVVATAGRLASHRRRAIHVLSMLTVPSSESIDAPMKAEEIEASSAIERAKLVVGGLRATGEVKRVRPQQAGYEIAAEARRIGAEAIVVGLRRRGGMPYFDEDVRRVLAERPCRVIVVSPGRSEAEGRLAPVPEHPHGGRAG